MIGIGVGIFANAIDDWIIDMMFLKK